MRTDMMNVKQNETTMDQQTKQTQHSNSRDGKKDQVRHTKIVISRNLNKVHFLEILKFPYY